MSRLILPNQWNNQPQYPGVLNPDILRYVSSARLWSTSPTVSPELVYNTLGGFAKTGTIDIAASIGGIGVKGDGSTGLYSRTISVVPQASWIMAQFVAGTTSIALKCAYGLGSSAASAGAYQGIFAGDGAANTINCQLRPIDGGATEYIQKYGPTVVDGTLYTVIGVFPSNLKADAYIYVNGVKYTTDLAGSTDITFVGANTWVNEAVGALKRGTNTVFGSGTVLFTARGTGQIPEALARRISENPYRELIRPKQRNLYASVGGTDVSVNVTGVTGTSALGSETVTADANATTTGVTGTSALGTVSITADATTSVTGVTGTSALGSVTVDVGGSVSANVTGVTGTSALGTVSVTAVRVASVSVTGVTGTSALGTVSVVIGGSADVSVSVTGVTGTTGLGKALVWGLIDTSQTPNWVRIAT